MTEPDIQSALAAGIGGGTGTVVAAVAERFFRVSYPGTMAITTAVSITVSVGLLLVICD